MKPDQTTVARISAGLEAWAAKLGMDESGGLSDSRFLQAWKGLASLGLFSLPFPGKSGGGQRPWAETELVLEALGRHIGFNGLSLSVGAQLWAVQAPLAEFGTPEQKRRYLAPLCRGQALAAPAVTEKEAGSGVLDMQAVAERQGAGYRVSAQKSCVTSAPLADFFLVWARLPGRQGPMSLDCFIVPRKTRGLTTSRFRWELGPAGALSGTVKLAGCDLPESARLGRECQGLAVFLSAMSWERRLILAPAIGAMEKRLEAAARFACERRQSGRPIRQFQAVSHKLADMKIRLEACRAFLRQACLAADLSDEGLSSAVKVFISEAWVANCLDAVELHGAAGCQDPGLRCELGAALASRIMSGTNELQRNLVAARLALSSR